ncbi:alpha/beta fold hydrolase [Micromonospora sp. NPDC049523]|uniref:alpha/beta fold hydrolase n=1 Tax=Micromonospora sp. NPDC049523 TaxID=3155921 RepID=UPI00342C4AF8
MVHRFRSFDGVEIAYQRWGTPDGTPPVVLHHGFVVDASTNFVGPGVVAALTTAGRWVVAPDARGHGASSKPHDPARYGEAAMARDLAALVDLLDVDRIDAITDGKLLVLPGDHLGVVRDPGFALAIVDFLTA